MARIKDYLMDIRETERKNKFKVMNYLNKIDGLFNPEELESKIITVGQLNNILGNDIALLKVIDIETSYNYSYSDLNEIKGTEDQIFKTLEADTDIYIKVLTTKETYFLKVREELDYNNPVPVTLELLESIIRKNHKNRINRAEYSYLLQGFRDGIPRTRFTLLNGVEFLVTGLGIELDPRANILDNLIILDGVPSDYRKIELE